MKCPLCGVVHVKELTFAEMYEPDPPCRKCQAIIAEATHIESIPVAGGIIDYRFLSESRTLDHATQAIYSFKFSKVLEMAISHDLILLIDDYEYQTFSAWFPLYSKYQKITFISVCWMDIAGKCDRIP